MLDLRGDGGEEGRVNSQSGFLSMYTRQLAARAMIDELIRLPSLASLCTTAKPCRWLQRAGDVLMMQDVCTASFMRRQSIDFTLRLAGHKR